MTRATAFRYAGASASGPSGLDRDRLDRRRRPHLVDQGQPPQFGDRRVEGRRAIAEVRAQRDDGPHGRAIGTGDLAVESLGEPTVHERGPVRRAGARQQGHRGSLVGHDGW